MDAHHTNDEFVVTFDLPGVAPDTIEPDVDRNVLTVKAERRPAVTGDQVETHVSERPLGRFSHRLFLGDSLDTDHITADHDAGVLTLRIPVSERAKPRRIEIGGRPPEGDRRLRRPGGHWAARSSRAARSASPGGFPNEVAPVSGRGRLVAFPGVAMTDPTDPYRVLGVPAGATREEIAAAYHRLVRQYHPDSTRDGAESGRFREVVAAYRTLRRPRGPLSAPAGETEAQPAHSRWAEPALRVGPVRYHGPPRG